MAEARPRAGRAGTLLLALAALALAVAGTTLASGPRYSDPDSAARAVAGSGARGTGPAVAPRTAGPSGDGATSAPPGPVRPGHVLVPALGVRADVTAIRAEDGVLTPPSDPKQVGWWSGGARPGGASGAAVLTGHTVSTGGGAFDDLDTLARGDRVVVGSARGDLVYEVSSVQVLSRAELADRSGSLFAGSGPARLVLVTCEDWDGTAYRSNVVVTARPQR